MKMRINIWGWCFGIAGAMAACVEAYDLPVQQADVRFLVVDGYLDTSEGEVNVNLLRAATITEKEFVSETGAVVALEDGEGNRYSINEESPGKYKGTTPLLDVGKEYRVYIKTTAGKEYRSLFIPIKQTPEITDVEWTAYDDGVQITVDTEDKSMNTRYYRWTFEETWEYHSRFVSYWKVEGDTVVSMRAPDEMIDRCFKTEASSTILTASTSGFTEDKVNDFDLVFLPKGTHKLGWRYSILVKQFAISAETYDYYDKLKKTSQNLGSLFDPQPSKVTGNISNIADPGEVVLGYFNVGRATEKRIYITPQELPASLRVVDKTEICYVDTIQVFNIYLFAPASDHTLIEQVIEDEQIKGFAYAQKECVDCRVKGGVTTKPDFWQ